MARQQARRHRRERLGGIVLAALGVIVLFVAVLALRDPRSTGSSASAPSTTIVTRTHNRAGHFARGLYAVDVLVLVRAQRAADQPGLGLGQDVTRRGAGSAAAHAIPLLVLNNTTIQGLAASAAQRFEAGGWTVTGEGNLTNTIISTCAYYDPDVTDAKAAAAVLQAQYPTIKRVRPRFGGLPSGPLVVVLTPDYAPDLSGPRRCAMMGTQPNSSAHPEGQRDRPVEAPANRARVFFRRPPSSGASSEARRAQCQLRLVRIPCEEDEEKGLVHDCSRRPAHGPLAASALVCRNCGSQFPLGAQHAASGAGARSRSGTTPPRLPASRTPTSRPGRSRSGATPACCPSGRTPRRGSTRTPG